MSTATAELTENLALSDALSAYRLAFARNFLVDFIPAMDKTYQIKWYHELLCKKCDDLLAGKINKLMVFLPPQRGKFLPFNTPVWTTKGWKNHSDLTDADFVFGEDGLPKKVLFNSGIYKWPVVEIEFQNGQTIKCAKEHLWKVLIETDGHKTRGYKRTEYVLETQDIFKKKNRRSPAIQDTKALDGSKDVDLIIDPYLFGVWLGDGHKDASYITVGKQDIDHFSCLGRSKEVKPGIFTVYVKGLRTKLREIGVFKNKHIPVQYFLSSKAQRTSLLQGLMDTDGCCDSHGRCEFCQMSGQLAEDVYLLLRNLGV